MARPRGVGKRKAIRGNLTPPRGARLTGEQLPDGRPVFRIKRAVKVGVQPMVDAAGRPVMKQPHPGLPPEQRMAPVMEFRDVEFVIDDGGNGMTWMNFSFRPSTYELEAARRRSAQERGLEELGELATAAAERGISIRALIAEIRGDDGGSDAEPAAPAVAEAPAAERKATNGKQSDILANAKARLKK